MLVSLASILAALAGASGAVAKSFTPVDMLTTPRPHDGIAAPDGKHALTAVDQWDQKSDTTTRTVYLVNLEGIEVGASGHKGGHKHKKKRVRELFSSPPGEASELLWLSEHTVAYLNGTTVYHFSVASDSSGHVMRLVDLPKGTDPSSLTYESESHTLAFSAAVWTDNEDIGLTAKTDKAWENRGYSAVVYDDLMVRHWDTWRIPGRVYTIAATQLNRRKKRGDDGSEFETSSKHTFENVLKGTGLFSQTDPIGADQFSVSKDHIAVALKPKGLNTALHTRMDVYLFTKGADPVNLTPYEHGAISQVSFSPDHEKLAWLEMAKDGYESDKRVVTVHTLGGATEKWTSEWDRSPSTLTWGLASKTFYLTVERHGEVLPYHLSHRNRLPTPMWFSHSTSKITPLTKSTFLLSKSSFTNPTELFFLDQEDDGSTDPDHLPHEQHLQLTHFADKHLGKRLKGLGGEPFWFQGDDDRRVMAWVIKPAGWKEDDADASYPLAFFIHGGPQGAWTDSWSTRWNPALAAAQGYFVVAVNPTGSTGYGQEFTDRIQAHWGDRPFNDLLLGYRAALQKYPQIDPERTAALGASYGGYMVNWINGHNDFGFKTLVWHDGIFDTVEAYYSTEEVFFPTQDFDGTPETSEAFEKWNPSRFVGNWSTPQLLIHGGKDYRLAETHALSTFTALQLRKVPSRFVYFPDENHWVLKAANSVKWHHEVYSWLDTYVGHGKKGAEVEGETDSDVLEEVERLIEQEVDELVDELQDLVDGAGDIVQDIMW